MSRSLTGERLAAIFVKMLCLFEFLVEKVHFSILCIDGLLETYGEAYAR